MDHFSTEAAHLISQNCEKLAMELVFAEAGRDNGLLPVNSLLGAIEEWVASNNKSTPSTEFIAGLAAGRQLVDDCLVAGAFEPGSLAMLRRWAQWLQSVNDAIASNSSISAWNPDQSVASCPQPEAAPASDPFDDAEVTLVLNLADDSDLLKEFVAESIEHLQNIESGVLVLEEHPRDSATLASIFRAFHTFKGGSGFLNLIPINRLAHELESLLELLRQEKLQVTPDIISIILEGGDLLKRFITSIDLQLTGEQPVEPILYPTRPLKAKIRRVIECPGEDEHVVAGSVQELSSEQEADKEVAVKSSNQSASVKVPIEKLDSLIDLVGEMVIAQSLVAQDQTLKSNASPLLLRNMAQLGRITKELQKTAMSLRMVPVRAAFQKLNRVVRDLAAKTSKEVELLMTGEETELDRTIVEEISDPLIHMIRNSVDHGIERPEVRAANGKKRKGTIHLKAFHQSGNIIIQILDDGSGLNKKRIEEKAIASGLIKPDHNLADKDIYSLIFSAGFSTAERVTDLSGRGVGMDVVRRNIDKMRGKIEITTTEGKGTTFTISLPLTLAIIDGLIVQVGHHRYIIPTLAVRESFRPTQDQMFTLQEKGEMITVRNQIIPLLRLSEFFGVKAAINNPMEAIVLVIESSHETRCVMVDKLIGKQEVVIKSLGETFQSNEALAGAAILGDGLVGLIVDASALVHLNKKHFAQAA